MFHHPKKKLLIYYVVTSHCPSKPWCIPLICILSLWIYLFWIFYVVELLSIYGNLLCLAVFHFACFWGLSSCRMNQCFIPFYGWVITHYMYMPQLIHFSIDRYLGCLHFLAIVNSASMIVCVCIWVPVFTSFGDIPKSWRAESYCNATFKFLRNHQTVFPKATLLDIPSSSAGGFLHTFANTR